MFGKPARNCGIRSESFSTAPLDRRRPQVSLEQRRYLKDPRATRGNCEGTASRTPIAAASPSSAASWPNCTRPALLCIDEVGYLTYDAHAADLLFQVVNHRYEHNSILLITNKGFKE